ncbi:hypothetical protein BZG36_03892 [Bifiguratus adelaidae]|uniref:Splicing factor YJU2 n=1 Tax=Bifiguratus adelaidae TaxID=1938954 RepID=A0A261XXR4_9FUNG|nr:hypothetical protein BZG36_03892 [Bifiguratus adelaidae]
MSERKVLNKYFPPNFDPAAIPRRKMPKDQQQKVRLMAPFSMQCTSCNEYIYKGKKFNAKKETVEGEMYLNIKIFRFYIRCPRCSAEITFKTDPKNTDYAAEHGAVRNFEPWREEGETAADRARQKEEEEENNPMKALENRTLDSKREMDILDALDEIRTRNARNERVDSEEILARFGESERAAIESQLAKEMNEDDELAKRIFGNGEGERVKRLLESEEPDAVELAKITNGEEVTLPTFAKASVFKRPKVAAIPANGTTNGIKIKKKVVVNGNGSPMPSTRPIPDGHTKAPVTPVNGTKPTSTSPAGLPGLVGVYGSDDDSS